MNILEQSFERAIISSYFIAKGLLHELYLPQPLIEFCGFDEGFFGGLLDYTTMTRNKFGKSLITPEHRKKLKRKLQIKDDDFSFKIFFQKLTMHHDLYYDYDIDDFTLNIIIENTLTFDFAKAFVLENSVITELELRFILLSYKAYKGDITSLAAMFKSPKDLLEGVGESFKNKLCVSYGTECITKKESKKGWYINKKKWLKLCEQYKLNKNKRTQLTEFVAAVFDDMYYYQEVMILLNGINLKFDGNGNNSNIVSKKAKTTGPSRLSSQIGLGVEPRTKISRINRKDVVIDKVTSRDLVEDKSIVYVAGWSLKENED